MIASLYSFPSRHSSEWSTNRTALSSVLPPRIPSSGVLIVGLKAHLCPLGRLVNENQQLQRVFLRGACYLVRASSNVLLGKRTLACIICYATNRICDNKSPRHHDALLAKCSCHGSTYEIVRRKMLRALVEFRIRGVKTKSPDCDNCTREINVLLNKLSASRIRIQMLESGT